MVRGLECGIPLNFPVGTLLETWGGTSGQSESVCDEWESSLTGHVPSLDLHCFSPGSRVDEK